MGQRQIGFQVVRHSAPQLALMRVHPYASSGSIRIGAQCSGTLMLAKLGLLQKIPACTDLITKPWVQEAGVDVLNQPFYADGNVATAGGCLASQYLATWIIARFDGVEAAKADMH